MKPAGTFPPRLVSSLPRLQWKLTRPFYAPQKIRGKFWRRPRRLADRSSSVESSSRPRYTACDISTEEQSTFLRFVGVEFSVTNRRSIWDTPPSPARHFYPSPVSNT